MEIGEFTKYGLVFLSSLTGATAGYFYSNRPINLRMRLERKGIRVLRASDKLWMYERIIKQNREEIKKVDELKAHFNTENDKLNPTEEQAIALLDWCEKKLTESKYSSSWENQVSRLCAYPV